MSKSCDSIDNETFSVATKRLFVAGKQPQALTTMRFLICVLGLATLASARSVIDPIPIPPGEETNGLCAQKKCPAGFTCKLLPNIDCKENCELFANCIAPNIILNGSVPLNDPSLPCGQNEERKVCGSACEPSCNVSEPIACTLQCIANVCQCKLGYYRNNAGACVTKDQCPNNGGSNLNGSPLTCRNILCQPGFACKQETINCIRAPCPQPRPRCVPSNSTLNPCASMSCAIGQRCEVKQVQCIRAPCDPIGECVADSGNNTPTCGLYETLDPCGGCERTCEQRNRMCNLMCRRPACVCQLGFFRHNGACVPESQCPATTPSNGSCGVNEEKKSCGTACEPSCQTPNPEVCTEQCLVNVCQCKNDYYRNETGVCVELNKCNSSPPGTITCANIRCGYNTECKMVEVKCKKAPCPTRPQCVPRKNETDTGSKCALIDCRDGYRCEEKPRHCFVAPCPTDATCVPIAPSNQTCETVKCPVGTTCQQNKIMCINPPCSNNVKCVPDADLVGSKCEVTDCRSGYTCIEEPLPCSEAPCPVRARCVNGPTCANARLSCKDGEQCGMKNNTPTCVPVCARNETWVEISGCEHPCGSFTNACTPGPSACECTDGYSRNSSGFCVLRKDCPIDLSLEACKTMKCSQGYQCGLQHGRAACVRTYGSICAATSCLVGSACIEVSTQCLVAPCPITSKCISTGSVTCENANLSCEENYTCKMENGLPTCSLVGSSSCASTTCLSGSHCVEEAVPCLVAPCPVQARCVFNRKNNTDICERIRMKCPAGYQCGAKDGSASCVRAPGSLCNVTFCTPGYYCREDAAPCQGSLCPVTASCVNTAIPANPCDTVKLKCKSGEQCGLVQDKPTCVPVCPKNQTWADCSGCDETCAGVSMVCPAVCGPPKCQCKPGYVKRVTGGDCVLISDCPSSGGRRTTTPRTPTTTTAKGKCGNTTCPPGTECNTRLFPGKPTCVNVSSVTCPKNEVHDVCGGCEGTCTNISPVCTMSCKSPGACVCAPGMVRQNGKCVAYNECKAKDTVNNDPRCEATEDFTDCKPSCEDSCSGHACNATITAAVCKSGCVCKKNYKRDASGKCRHSRQCYQNAGCGKNEEWGQCLPCEKKCSDYVFNVCTKDCYSGCTCKPGYARDSFGNCVDEDFGCYF